MLLGDKEIKFRRSIYTEKLLRDRSKDKNVQTIFEMFGDPDPFARMDAMITFCMCMHDGYERYASFMDKSYDEAPMERKDWENLTEKQLMIATTEGLEVWNEDAQQEVQAEPTEKNAQRQSKGKV